MTQTRLKTLLLIVWGSFLAILAAILLVFWMQNRSPVPASAASAPPTLPAPGPTRAEPATPSPAPTQKTISTPTALPSNTPAQTIAVPLALNLPADYNPYTGQPVADTTLFERRPIAVKITNFPRRVRAYQYSLTIADVAYEYYIESGLTRFIAIFYGQDSPKVGPVRSGRYFDEHIARMYNSYLVFANADPRVEEHLLNSDILQRLFVSTDNNCPPLCRDKSINDYNNLFLDTAGLTEYTRKIGHDNSRQQIRSTYFDLMPPAWPLEINEVNIRYSMFSYHTWRYDPARQLYDRFADAADARDPKDEIYQPHIDILTDRQISAANVVVLIVNHNFKTEFDREDQVFDIQLVGEGQAYVFRQGRGTAAIWQRDELNQPIRLLDLNRNPIGLTPGHTFYLVLNPESSLEQGEKSVRFTFNIPSRYPTPTTTPIGFIPSPTPRKP